MSRLLSDANVTIRMKGLGVAHHNVGKGLWEFIFLRGIADHDLEVTVREYRASHPKPIETKYPIPETDKRIEIISKDAVHPRLPSHDSGKNFRWRHDVDDIYDARWMIDLSEELHGTPVKLRNKKDIGLTLLTISDAQFYTDTLVGKDFPYRIEKNGQRFKERAVGQWLGLDIRWDVESSQTDIIFETFQQKTLKADNDVSIYEIEVNNDCCEGEPVTDTDFRLYYEYLVDMEGVIFDELLPVIPSKFSAAKSLFKGRDDCHLVQIARLDGMESLEELL